MRIFVVATLAVLLASDAHAQNSMVFTEGMDATSIEAAMNEWTNSPLKNVESSAFSFPLSSSSWADRVVVSAVG